MNKNLSFFWNPILKPDLTDAKLDLLINDCHKMMYNNLFTDRNHYSDLSLYQEIVTFVKTYFFSIKNS